MTQMISEIVKKVEKAETKEEKVKILTEHKDRIALRDLLIISYDPRVELLVPDTDPPFKESDASPGMGAPMDTFIRMFRLFIKGKGYDHMKQPKREMKFIEICESLHKDDARIFLDAFHKNLRLTDIGPAEIQQVWGYEIPESVKKEEETEEPEKTPAKKKSTPRKRKTTTTKKKQETKNETATE